MSELFPSGYDEILKGLLEWSRSGLIPNTEVVKSYHPPQKDPITGITVLVPATVYKTESFTDYDQYTFNFTSENGVNPLKGYLEKPYSSIDNLPNSPNTGSNVRDWNVNVEPGGLDTAYARYVTPQTNLYYDAAAYSETQQQYENNISAQANLPVTAERLASGVGTTVPYITDDIDDTKNWYSIEPIQASFDLPPDPNEIERLKVAKGITESVQPDVLGITETPVRYELLPTKAPCSLPGVLNCRLVKYNGIDGNPYNPSYADPRYDMTEIPDSMKAILKEPTHSPTPPNGASKADRWWDTNENKLYVYDGTYWVMIGTANTTVYQLKGNINY